MILNIIILTLAIALLLWSTNIMINGAIALSHALRVSMTVIGLLIGVGTSIPELSVSVIAAIYDNARLGVANALGSNIVNIGLALGFGAIFSSISLDKKTFTNQYLILIGVTIILGLLMLDHYLSRYDGILLLALLLPVLYFMSKTSPHETAPPHTHKPFSRFYLEIFGGLTLLIISSHYTVESAVNIGHLLNIDKAIIGLSVIAIGTSLPELLTVIVSLWKKQPAIAIGNILGSNILNGLGVIGATILVTPLPVNSALLERDYMTGVFLTLLLFLLLFIKPNFIISRWKGTILLICFFSYMLKLYNDAFINV